MKHYDNAGTLQTCVPQKPVNAPCHVVEGNVPVIAGELHWIPNNPLNIQSLMNDITKVL
jgi:hypothetical protein